MTVREKVPNARKLVDASKYYPEAAIVGGWVARNEFVEKNQATLISVIKGWVTANDDLLANQDKAIAALQSKHYPNVAAAAFADQFKASKYFTSAEWRKLYADGTATRWLQQVTDFFVAAGGIQNPVPASKYFVPKLYLDTVKA